ncbi:hemin uptake protein HemP [Woeseia oceani]|uniref:hemin uptake protein HemP n=1 Tax=Woeseia oceani TaxID=1548547 RepID=UPI0009F2ECAC
MKPETPKPTKRTAHDKTLLASELFQGRQEIRIAFNREIYRLRITRNQKLILTK